ncbi:MAG: copper amine oxidase N-terminal domain-containing protein [Acidaminobacteraceae bacterium]
MNRNIKNTLVALMAVTLLLGATLVSFANDKLEPEVIKIDNPNSTLDINRENKSYEKATPVLISTAISNEYANAISENLEITYEDNKIEFDVKPVIKDGKVMIPLSAVLKAMDYKYEWKKETLSVDIMKGVNFTTIYIGKNDYFKNKMAARPLSTSPIIIEGRTLVAVEFFSEILGLSISVKENLISFSEGGMAFHYGYITEISKDEDGNSTITLTKVKDSTEMMDKIIIHTRKGETIFNNSNIVVGEFVNVISPMFMTMSIPAQTSGVVIY